MLTLICGLPNAGKTTYSKKYNNVIHGDEIQDFSEIYEIVSVMDDICVEWIFLDSYRRKKVLSAYRGDHKVCIWLDTSIEECLKRENRNRGAAMVRNCSMIFEPPTFDEGWDEIIRIENNGE